MTTSPLPSAPAAVAATRSELRGIVAAALDLEAAVLVDLVAELETLGRTVSAAQAELTARLDALLTQEQADAGVRPEELGKGVGNVVAAARRESPHRGRRHLSLARVVQTELPHTWAAWQDGRIDEWTTTVIARETACLPLAHRLAVDEVVAGDPTRSSGSAPAGCWPGCARRPSGSTRRPAWPAVATPSPSAA